MLVVVESAFCAELARLGWVWRPLLAVVGTPRVEGGLPLLDLKSFMQKGSDVFYFRGVCETIEIKNVSGNKEKIPKAITA